MSETPEQRPNAENPQSTISTTGIPADGLVTSQIGKRIVKYTLLSNSDLLVLTLLNSFATIFFSLATFFYGNVYLSIKIQSLFAVSIPENQLGEIRNLQYFSEILIWVFIVLGLLSLIFRYLILRIARIESLQSREKNGFWGSLFKK
jgi:hypothetical protein